MNFEPFAEDQHEPPRETIRCFSSFNNAECYEYALAHRRHSAMVFLGIVLMVACIADLVAKARAKHRITRKGIVIVVLMLQCFST